MRRRIVKKDRKRRERIQERERERVKEASSGGAQHVLCCRSKHTFA